MIKFFDIDDSKPYDVFKQKYSEAFKLNQPAIEAICISSIANAKEVDSRFVNLKMIKEDKWIFFSNYESEKAMQFEKNNNISAIFYWNVINTQIRIKATIHKMPKDFNKDYFETRKKEKNALAISSRQSKRVDSFEDVNTAYLNAMQNKDLTKCPDYWGGFSFIPSYFEFWEGHKNRLNRRMVFQYNGKKWDKYLLQP